MLELHYPAVELGKREDIEPREPAIIRSPCAFHLIEFVARSGVEEVLKYRTAVVSVVAVGALVAFAGVAGADTGSAATGSGVIDTGSGILGDLLDTGSGVLGGGASGGSAGAVQQCNRSTKSGGEGVTTTVHQLGVAGPTTFVLSYETLNIPDRIQAFYEGAQVLDTGYVGDNLNEGTGSAVVSLPAGTATTVTVRVSGLDETKWEYTVNCPV